MVMANPLSLCVFSFFVLVLSESSLESISHPWAEEEPLVLSDGEGEDRHPSIASPGPTGITKPLTYDSEDEGDLESFTVISSVEDGAGVAGVSSEDDIASVVQSADAVQSGPAKLAVTDTSAAKATAPASMSLGPDPASQQQMSPMLTPGQGGVSVLQTLSAQAASPATITLSAALMATLKNAGMLIQLSFFFFYLAMCHFVHLRSNF